MRVTLVCPFCDENTTALQNGRVYSPGKIYTPRKCPMGHIVYSVEEIPQNQSKIEDEIQAIRAYNREQARLKLKKKWAEKRKAKKAERVSSIKKRKK